MLGRTWSDATQVKGSTAARRSALVPAHALAMAMMALGGGKQLYATKERANPAPSASLVIHVRLVPYGVPLVQGMTRGYHSGT